MNYVNFNRQKDRTFASSIDSDTNTIYFTSDTHEIIINGLSYGPDLLPLWNKISEVEVVTSAALNHLNDVKQDKTDNSLETDSKFVVGAINELNAKFNEIGQGNEEDYLPLAGGTMSGTIVFKNADMLKHNETNILQYNDSDSSLCLGENTGGQTEIITLSANDVISTGNINAPAFYETSDIRKKDIKTELSLDKCYDLIDKCQTVIYSLKDQTQEQIGMIALEIEEFFPEVVSTNKEGFKSLAYDRLVVICFKVLKDIIGRLKTIENTINNGTN